VALAKAAKTFKVPTTITTVETDSFSGNTYPEISLSSRKSDTRANLDEFLGRPRTSAMRQEKRTQEGRAGRTLDRICT